MDAKPKKATRAATSAKNLKRKKEETPASDISDMAAAGGDNANAKKICETISEEQRVKFESVLTQPDLEELAASERGKNATALSIGTEAEYEDDDPPAIDFGAVSFPNLESLAVYFQAVKAFNFQAKDYPKLKHLYMNNMIGNIEGFDFDLPLLETINFQHVGADDPRGFGKSVSRSTKLSNFTSYKLWGLHMRNKYLTLVLPNCESVDFYRSDTLVRVKLWAPKLRRLNLQACFDLAEVIILDDKPHGYKRKEYEFLGEPSKYAVNVMNMVDPPGGNVLTHPRCARVFGKTCGEFLAKGVHQDKPEDDLVQFADF
ncbi:uncharacterized protein [Littorina saxatilis]|uniref:Uncharacterized protein n=1 Tax=Littorina saxatilis TaxID=31220 RepID=A0AAN9GQ39_9CAEN